VFQLPDMPAWEGLHPVVVHLPLGALFVAPLLLLAAIVWPRRSKGLVWGAFAVVAVGTLGVMLAVSTGQATEHATATGIPRAAHDTFERHEELAETTRSIFIGLAVALALLLGAWEALRSRVKHWMVSVGAGAYLTAYAVGLLALANTGHEGGRLVHEFGVRANLAGAAPGAAGSAGASNVSRSRDHDDD